MKRTSPRKRESALSKPVLSSRGMKGNAVTTQQRAFWDALVLHVGCIACRLDGRPNHECSIHHIEGRTKPGAHWLVLPLCAGHHQDGTGWPGLIAVHPWKTRFEERYGAQIELLGWCCALLETAGAVVSPQIALAVANRGGRS